MSEDNVLRIRPTGLNTTRQHRDLSERVFVRFPGLVRALNLLRLRLPIRSRLRRSLLLRLAAMAFAAINRRDFDLLETGIDPEIDYIAAGVLPADMAGHHHGHSGYRENWRRLDEAFDSLRIDPEELIDTGDRIISLVRASAHGAGSGVPVSVTYFQVISFRDGLVIRQEDIEDRAEAFKAAGLSK